MTKAGKVTSLLVILLVIVSFISYYAGHFLFDEPVDNNPGSKDTPNKNKRLSIEYENLRTNFKGNDQVVNILDIDLSDPRVEIKPVLSHDLIYGYEKLSSMASRSKAYAAVNAGFFHEYGEPIGMVVIDGKIITGSSGKYPVLVVSDRKAELREIKLGLGLSYEGGYIPIDGINRDAKPGEIILYTPMYGRSSRTEMKNASFLLQDGMVKGMSVYEGAANIPPEGMLLSFYYPYFDKLKMVKFTTGDGIQLVSNPAISKDTQAYECGSWIVKNGKVVIGSRDPLVGVMTNNDPRTAVGIKENGRVVFLTIDGRQPGYSKGMTGKELGEYLLKRGIKNAAMLDGGASTEMIIGSRIVNKPSDRGRERPLAGGFIIKYKRD